MTETDGAKKGVKRKPKCTVQKDTKGGWNVKKVQNKKFT